MIIPLASHSPRAAASIHLPQGHSGEGEPARPPAPPAGDQPGPSRLCPPQRLSPPQNSPWHGATSAAPWGPKKRRGFDSGPTLDSARGGALGDDQSTKWPRPGSAPGGRAASGTDSLAKAFPDTRSSALALPACLPGLSCSPWAACEAGVVPLSPPPQEGGAQAAFQGRCAQGQIPAVSPAWAPPAFCPCCGVLRIAAQTQPSTPRGRERPPVAPPEADSLQSCPRPAPGRPSPSGRSLGCFPRL